MSKYTESMYVRFNEFLAGYLRGQVQKDGAIDPTKVIIPPIEEYITEVDTNDAFQDIDTTFELPLFTPGGQEPETLVPWDSVAETFKDLPIATYTVLESRKRDTPWERCGQVTYTFYHGNVDKLMEITSFLADLCGREDWTAADVNHFFATDETNPYEFKFVVMMNSAGPVRPEDEGGRYAWIVSIYMSATYEGVNRIDSHDQTINLGMI